MFQPNPDACHLPLVPRLSPRTSPPPAFFRLLGLRLQRLVPLETPILLQDGPRRIGDPLPASDTLVGAPADIGGAQETDALAPRLHNDLVVAVHILRAAGMHRLRGRGFQPLAP